jgi:hypothetical protein
MTTTQTAAYGTPAYHVQEYRRHTAALRRLVGANAAAQRTGRNGDATSRSIAAHAAEATVAIFALIDPYNAPRMVTGALIEEHGLLARGVKGRPELRARLTSARATIAAYLTTLEG